jgi:hypothetical protein
MAIGEFTKQLAQQAILNVTSVTKEPPKEPPAPPEAENVGATIVAQLNAMQKALKENEELMVYFQGIRVMEIYLPTWGVAVLSGVGQDRAMTRAISPVGSLQLAVRVGKAQPGAKAARINVVTPKT